MQPPDHLIACELIASELIAIALPWSPDGPLMVPWSPDGPLVS